MNNKTDGSRKERRIHAETVLSYSIALPRPAKQQKIAKNAMFTLNARFLSATVATRGNPALKET
jgi:hypothetical protein